MDAEKFEVSDVIWSYQESREISASKVISVSELPLRHLPLCANLVDQNGLPEKGTGKANAGFLWEVFCSNAKHVTTMDRFYMRR